MQFRAFLHAMKATTKVTTTMDHHRLSYRVVVDVGQGIEVADVDRVEFIPSVTDPLMVIKLTADAYDHLERKPEA